MGLKKKSFDSVGTPWCTDFIIINIIINTCPTMGQNTHKRTIKNDKWYDKSGFLMYFISCFGAWWAQWWCRVGLGQSSKSEMLII